MSEEASGPGEGDRAERARRKGRTAALAIFYTLVVIFIAIPATQLSQQVYAPPTGNEGSGSCAEGLRLLVKGVDDAKAASQQVVGSDEALLKFRAVVGQAYQQRARVERVCREAGDASMLEALATIDRYRHAEENAARRDGDEVAPARAAVKRLLDGPLSPKP